MFRISSRGLCSFLFPDFVPGWLVLRLLRWCSAVSSCFPAFSRLADPCYFYSPALSLLLYSWRLCSSCFPPSRLWSSRLAFHSVTVPLVYSLLLLECSYSPQLFCGSSWVSASCLAPEFGGFLTRVYLFCVFGLYRFGLLPFLLLRCLTAWGLFPLAGLLLYGCIRSLVPRSSTVVLCSVACLQSDFPTLVVVMLFPPSSFRTPSVCRLCSWCLRDGVTLAWVECRCCFLHSIGTKATFLSVLSIPSGWGHPLGQVCFLFPLISIEGSLSFWFLFLPLGSRVRCLCLPLVPWVGFIVGLCAPLLCVASF